MRRIVLTLVLALAVIGAAAGVASAFGAGQAITKARLEHSLVASFSNQYAQQAQLLGHHDVTPASLNAKAMCEKGGPDVPDVGPGSDWICLVGWQDANVPMPPEGYGKFEVVVHSNDCYTAGGPSKLVGFQTITDKRGRTVNNPVYEFDGCFDPNGDNTPSAVRYPSVLQVTSTSVPVTADGKAGVQVSCGAGSGGCAGTMQVSVGKRTLGSVPYRITEQATPTIALPAGLPRSAKEVTLTFTADAGVAPSSEVVLPLQR